MESPYQKELANGWGPSNAVTPFQIRAMFEMGELSKSDVYFDLGSGHGRTVRIAVAEFGVKRAIGIEHEPERYCHARGLAKSHLSSIQLEKVDFWLQEMDDTVPTGVTIAYYGLDRNGNEPEFFKSFFGMRRVRIILKDLPIIEHAPIRISHKSRTTWFFLVSYPLGKHKVRTQDEWAKSVLGAEATIRDVYKYYDRQLKKTSNRRSSGVHKIVKKTGEQDLQKVDSVLLSSCFSLTCKP
jgi:hypothetical protein